MEEDRAVLHKRLYGAKEQATRIDWAGVAIEMAVRLEWRMIRGVVAVIIAVIISANMMIKEMIRGFWVFFFDDDCCLLVLLEEVYLGGIHGVFSSLGQFNW